MSQNDIIGKERDAEFNFLKDVLAVIEERPFERQIRSEECGCCTRNLAEQIYQWVSANKEAAFLVVIWLLERIRFYHYLPQFTQKIMECALTLMGMQIRRIQGLGNTPHDRLCEVIQELADLAEEFYMRQRFLLFCRIAEPIIQISPNYRQLCKLANITPKQAATKSIERILELKEQLIHDQQQDPRWVDSGRKQLTGTIRRPKLKRVWSGGSCEILQRADGQSISGKMKVVYYNPEGMKVYSRKPLEHNCVYKCNVFFNCVDLPFIAEVAVEKTFTSPGQHDQDCMEKCKADHCYLLKFMAQALEPSPIPRYYFLSMCRELFEQRSPWEPEAFVETFCDSEWARAALEESS